MSQSKNSPTSGWARLSGLVRNLGPFASIAISSAVPGALAFADLSRIVSLFLATALFFAGAAQRLRASVRVRDRKYRPHPGILQLIRSEAGVARLWILTALVLGTIALLVPQPLLVGPVGAVATAIIFAKGIGSAGRSAEAEVAQELSKGSAAEQCSRVQRWANWAASARLVPGTECFHRLAHYSVPAGQVGPLHAAALIAVGLCFFAYVGLGIAAGVSQVAGNGSHKVTRHHGVRSGTTAADEADSPIVSTADSTLPPTYAESCPELPDPREIGHGLGQLFIYDGAVRAGCGGPASVVPETGVWISTGTCDPLGEQRSLAVAAPGAEPALLYGTAARFAAAAARRGELVGAEAVRPGSGDVDVVMTLEGNHVFARRTRSVGQGSEGIRWCWQARGEASPFQHLPPSLAWLWLELVRSRVAWAWPVADPADRSYPIAFEDHLTGERVALGNCDSEDSCALLVAGELWPNEGTAFVSLSELEPYLPAAAE